MTVAVGSFIDNGVTYPISGGPWALGGPTVVEFRDFAAPNSSGMWEPNGLVGAGVSAITYMMVPKSSTKTSPSTGTNQLHLMRAGGMNAAAAPKTLEVGGFTLAGTDQGHLYNGLQIAYSTGAHVHDLNISNIPGNSSTPPGETFSLSLWHADNALVEDVTIDGGSIAASLFATNSVEGGTYNRITARHTQFGFGAALWDSKDLTFTGCDFSNNRKGVNIEKPRGGFHTFTGCAFKAITGAAYQMQVNSDGLGPSTVVTVEDPVIDAFPFTVWVNASSQQLQKPSDIHLVLNGKDVSSDPAKLKIVG